MLSSVVSVTAVAAVMSVMSMSALAQSKGGLDCPKGKVEAKSFAAYYVPAKNALTIFFYTEAMSDDELDAQMANAAKFDAGDNAKGPGVGKPNKYVRYALKAWTRVSAKPGATVNAADFAKGGVYYSYVCESGKERVVSHDFKERESKVKTAFPAVTVELKQGGKISVTSKGAYDGDPKDKDKIKVAWNVDGTGKLRVYE